MKLVGIRFVLSLLLVLGMTTVSLALEPLTAVQIEQYKKDGTWEARQDAAIVIGNHKMAPELVAKTNYKLRRLAYQAEGKNIKDIDQILATPPPKWQGGLPSTGNVKMFVLLIEFDGYIHTAENDQTAVDSKVFGPENTESASYPYDSLSAYYARSSYGRLNLQGATLGWYNAGTRPVSPTGDRIILVRENLIKQAINYFDANGHDFSQYDNDGDGTIDGFAVIWTGPKDTGFWGGYQSHFWDDTYTVDGKKLYKYTWQPVSYPSVVFVPNMVIHETGHLLGLPDYYDYYPTTGPAGGLGCLDMMDNYHRMGGDHNAFSKFVLDWLEPKVISADGVYAGQTLSSSANSADVLLIMPNASGAPFEEFFMVQHRKREKNDINIPADGLLIWHIDAKMSTSGYDYLYNNSSTEHKLLRLMEADGLEEIEQGDGLADAGDFYKSGKRFTPDSIPNSSSYSGSTNVFVTNIASSGDDMVCDVAVGNVPSVSITSPKHLSVVNNSISIEATASGGSGIAKVEFFVNDTSVGIDTTAPYSVTWNSSTGSPNKYIIKAVAKDIADNISTDQVAVYLVNGIGKALVIDLGSDNHSGEAIEAALAKNNIQPVRADSIISGNITGYPLVFICLGYRPGNYILTDTDSAVLAAYLNNGGMLYMEGGDTWSHDPKLLIHSYFGINGVADGTDDLSSINGVQGGFADGMYFPTTGINSYVDHLEAENGGVSLLENSNPFYPIGIYKKTGKYVTLGCSFEFGNIANEVIQTQFVAMAAQLAPASSVPPAFLPAIYKLLLKH